MASSKKLDFYIRMRGIKMINQAVEKKYKDVQTSLEEALEKANSIKISGNEENAELSEIKKTLESLNNDFKTEIENLKNSSEWDKFCIAFFGETNAGKSTIIESLRIIYDEESRRAEALAQREEYYSELKKHCVDYQDLIASLNQVNITLEKQRKKPKLLYYIIAGIIGIAIGLILANTGMVVW